MSEISEVPMIEQAEAGTKLRLEFPPIPTPNKITEGNIDAAVKDVTRRAEERRNTFSNQAETSHNPITNDLIQSSDAVVTDRLKETLPEKARDALRLLAQKVAPTASALAIMISSGCGNIPNPFAKERAPTPTPISTPIDTKLFSLTPETTKTPIPTLTPTPKPTETRAPIPTPTIQPKETPTSKVEIQQPKVISMGGTVEPDPASRSAGETIKLVFPEGILDGKSPLIPEKDTLSASFRLKSATPIQQVSLSISKLLGIKSNESSVAMNPTNEGETTDIASAIRSFQRIAKFSLSDADQKIINRIALGSVRDSNGGVWVDLSLPNEPFTYTDKDGSHLVNPAERFVSGKIGLGINRRGKSASGTATTPIALAVENTKITNSKGELVATADRFDINPPGRIPVVRGTTQPDITIPTETPKPTSTPTKTLEPTKTPTPTPKETVTPTPKEKNKWTERNWAPNETVPIQEWWDDMVTKGYINIDAIAQQHAGEQINNFLKGANLVPNPVRYGYGGGPSYINNCNLELDKLVSQGQGHIKITSDAYAQIPGGVGCQIFTKK